MKPRAWVLVVGLNPHLNPNDNKIAQESIHGSGDWQTFWRDFNRDRRHWGSRYFQTWGRVASRAMGLDLTANESNDFVEQSVMFVEFCPYASPSWPEAQQVKWEQWKSIADQDKAIQVSRTFRQLLFEWGQPGLVLCNGKFAAWDVKDQQFDVTRMQERKASFGPDQAGALTLWTGTYQPTGGNQFPVIGFEHLTSRWSREKIDALVAFTVSARQHT